MENKDRAVTDDTADVRKTPNESSDDVSSNKEITDDESARKKLKTDHHDEAEDTKEKGKDVVVSVSGSAELKKRVGGDDQVMNDDQGKGKDPEVIIGEISELDKLFEEMIRKMQDVVDARKRLHRNLPLRHVLKETEESNKIVNELKTEHAIMKERIINSVLGGAESGKGTDVVVSCSCHSVLEESRELLEDTKAAVDVMKKLNERGSSKKEMEDYEKMMNELKRGHDKAMEHPNPAGAGSLEDVDSDINQSAGEKQSDDHSDDDVGKTTTDKSGSSDDLVEID